MKKISFFKKLDKIFLGAFLIFFKFCRSVFFLLIAAGFVMQGVDIITYAKSLSLPILLTLGLNVIIIFMLVMFIFRPVSKKLVLIFTLILIAFLLMHFLSADMLFLDQRRQCLEGSHTNCVLYNEIANDH